MPLWKNTPHLKTSVPFLSYCHPPSRIPHRAEHICKAAKFLQHCRHSSCAGQEKDAAPQENDPPHSWLQVEFLQGKLSHSSVPSLPLFLLSSSPSSRAEGTTPALTRHPFLPWLQNQGGDQAARGWNVGGRKGWRQCLLPTNQRQLLRDFVRLVGVSLGEGLSALCSTAAGSRSA